jgi:hypothetical protein
MKILVHEDLGEASFTCSAVMSAMPADTLDERCRIALGRG